MFICGIITSIFGILYTLLVSQFVRGWYKCRSVEKNESILETTVSVIVAFRNEEENIGKLLQAIDKQNYPKKFVEVILINDNSTDKSVEIIEKYTNITLLHLERNVIGKKAAVLLGFTKARGELCMCTDADCVFRRDWLLSMVKHYNETNSDMILGAVTNEMIRNSFFEKLVNLEFSSLIASAAGAVGIGNAIMSNGANYVVRKASLELNEESMKTDYASGDDVFLLHEFKKKRKKITFNTESDSMVFTKSPESLKEFFQQRIRWSSKSTKYKDLFTIYTAFVILLTSLWLTVLLFLSIFNLTYFILFVVFISCKMSIDSLLLIPYLRNYKLQKLSYLIVPMEFFYIIYITLVFILSMTMSFTWKGRRYKH